MFGKSLLRNQNQLILIVGVFILVFGLFSLFFLRRGQMIEVRMFLTEREEAKYWLNYPDGYLMENLHEGMSYRNEIGREEARVTDIYRINTSYQHEVALLTLSLRATYDDRTQTFSFQGQPLLVGGYRNIQFSGAQFSGYVVSIGETLPPIKEKRYLVSGELEDEDEATRGSTNTKVRAVLKQAVSNVGVDSVMRDSHDRVIARVLSLKTWPAVRTEYYAGSRYTETDPDLVSGTISVEIIAQEIDDFDYWNFITPVEVGQIAELNFNNTLVPFRITSIDSVEPLYDSATDH